MTVSILAITAAHEVAAGGSNFGLSGPKASKTPCAIVDRPPIGGWFTMAQISGWPKSRQLNKIALYRLTNSTDNHIYRYIPL